MTFGTQNARKGAVNLHKVVFLQILFDLPSDFVSVMTHEKDMTTKEQVMKDLEPMFDQAIREGLWFKCDYQALVFTPSELRECHSEGRFVWGVSNWRLINPKSLLKDPVKEAQKLEQHNLEIMSRK